MIKRHPEWGAKLLDELGGFSRPYRLVRDHHERLDGRGYPHGLTRGRDRADTRILTVCDVYDALISPRVYRPAWNHEQAMALLHARPVPLRRTLRHGPRAVLAAETARAGRAESRSAPRHRSPRTARELAMSAQPRLARPRRLALSGPSAHRLTRTSSAY